MDTEQQQIKRKGDKMLKVALIGLGGMGSVHLANWRKMEGVELVAVCDIRSDLAVEKAVNEKVYADIDELLEHETLDIVDVCTPSYLHKEHSIKAMKKGIHVLTEKPAALNSEDVAEMYRIAKDNHVKLMVAHVIRFMKDYMVLKEIYKSKKYGELLQGHFWRLSATPKWSWNNWMLDESKSGLVPYDLHIHDCDFIYSLLGKPNECHVTRSKVKENTYPDHYIAQYEYNNATIFAEAAWFDCDNFPFQAGFRVCFEHAIICLDGNGMKGYLSDGTVVDYATAAAAEDTGINLVSTDGYYEEMRYFKNCVEDDCQPEAVSCEEVIGVLTLIKEGVSAAKMNQTI